MTEREYDIRALCEAVIENAVKCMDNGSYCEWYECVFCAAKSDNSEESVQHEPNCSVLLAKKLMERAREWNRLWFTRERKP